MRKSDTIVKKEGAWKAPSFFTPAGFDLLDILEGNCVLW
jgi:hypothetical protein